METIRRILFSGTDWSVDAGLLLLRVITGSFMLVGHGWVKVVNFAALRQTFPDPIGLGSELSLLLAIFAEVLCASLVIAGALTRAAVVPLLVTMFTAAFVAHAGDPWAKQELPLLFAASFGALLLMGAGRFSVDGFFTKTGESETKPEVPSIAVH